MKVLSESIKEALESVGVDDAVINRIVDENPNGDEEKELSRNVRDYVILSHQNNLHQCVLTTDLCSTFVSNQHLLLTIATDFSFRNVELSEWASAVVHIAKTHEDDYLSYIGFEATGDIDEVPEDIAEICAVAGIRNMAGVIAQEINGETLEIRHSDRKTISVNDVSGIEWDKVDYNRMEMIGLKTCSPTGSTLANFSVPACIALYATIYCRKMSAGHTYLSKDATLAKRVEKASGAYKDVFAKIRRFIHDSIHPFTTNYIYGVNERYDEKSHGKYLLESIKIRLPISGVGRNAFAASLALIRESMVTAEVEGCYEVLKFLKKCKLYFENLLDEAKCDISEFNREKEGATKIALFCTAITLAQQDIEPENLEDANIAISLYNLIEQRMALFKAYYRVCKEAIVKGRQGQDFNQMVEMLGPIVSGEE